MITYVGVFSCLVTFLPFVHMVTLEQAMSDPDKYIRYDTGNDTVRNKRYFHLRVWMLFFFLLSSVISFPFTTLVLLYILISS
ncbi:unnamed protein product [Schistosoma rodhaini]|nr:unnamed protein product [Schistosoma rodhaini]